MRTVTTKDLGCLKTALAEFQGTVQHCKAQAEAAQAKLMSLLAAGRTAEAEQYQAEQMTRLHLLYLRQAAKFESKAVAFLGEPKGPAEDMGAYLDRITAACNEPALLYQIHRRNGIEFLHYLPGNGSCAQPKVSK